MGGGCLRVTKTGSVIFVMLARPPSETRDEMHVFVSAEFQKTNTQNPAAETQIEHVVRIHICFFAVEVLK